MQFVNLFLLLGALARLAAQDLDVALSPSAARGQTILDQVENRQEREAFELLYRETNPLSRRTLVSAFLQKFPSSWLLAQVCEAGANASFELGDSATGLFYAKASLRLYPENPLLTGSMAAVFANRGERTQARLRALDTFHYLQQFQDPAAVKASDWRGVRTRLLQTVHQVVGQLPASRVTRPTDARTAYSGSDSCRPCHAAQWNAWRQTGMANMLRKAAPDGLLADFPKLAQQSGGAAKGQQEHGKYFVSLMRPSGSWDRFPVDYTIGSKWQQAYATKAPNGELHVLPLQYNRLQQTWVNYWRLIDPPHTDRSDPGQFHRLRDVTNYQTNCAPCHTSQLQSKGFLEPGVNCEMCHGPAAAHAKGAPAQHSFKKMSHREYVGVCAQCHAQSAIRTQQAFPPQYQRRPYTEFSRKAFYRDGRFRETTFIVEAFERSACFRQGQAHCGHCHDPHPKNAGTNPTSLKFAPDDNQQCLQCHPASYADAKHTRHAAAPATQCVSCHMPKIMNSLLFPARSHQIDDIPRAEPTQRFGRTESPNACLTCHADRDDKWLSSQLSHWTPKPATSQPLP